MTDFQYYFGKRRSLAAIRSFDRRTTRSFRCLDCQRYTFDEYYMLLDEVWLSANPKRGDALHHLRRKAARSFPDAGRLQRLANQPQEERRRV